MTRKHDGVTGPVHGWSPRMAMNARPAGLPLPPWMCDDPERVVATLLDAAHRDLPAHTLAEVLLGARSALAPLRAGRDAPVPEAGRPPRAGSWSPAAREYLRPVRIALALGARCGGPEASERLGALARRIERQIEEVASRPRGVAAPR